MIYFHTRRYFSLSLFEESSKEAGTESSPSKRGRGRPPKLKAVCAPSLEETQPTQEDEKNPEITTENNYQPAEEVENVVTLNHIEDSSDEPTESEANWEIEQNSDFALNDVSQEFQENYSDDFCEEDIQNSSEIRDFSQNNISVSFSWSLMNQLRQMSKMEGISVEDLLVELVAEGVAKRVFEDQMRPTPSHLMTRTGYVHSDGTQIAPQPHLSHHTMNRQQQNNLQNRNRFGFQPRNSQQQNNNRTQINNRNYQQQNNNSRQQNPNQNNFRNQYQNNNAQHQRFNTRTNYQNSQRFYEDQQSNNQQSNNQYRQQRDNNKR